MEYSGVEGNEKGWSGKKCNGVEWSRVERQGIK